MVVYIEYIILNNLLINAFIIYAKNLLLKKANSFFRIFSASLIGVFIAILMPYLQGNSIIFVKFVTSFVLVYISAKQSEIKDYIFQLLIFYFITFSIGGGIYSLNYLLSNNIIFNFVNKKLVPFYFGLVSIFILYIIYNFSYLFAIFKHKTNIFKVKLSINGFTLIASGFYDTGNLLNYNNSPVSIIGRDTFLKIFGNDKFSELDYIKCSTVNGDSLLPVYEISELIIYRNKNQQSFFNTYIAVANKKINFDIILHNSIYFKED